MISAPALPFVLAQQNAPSPGGGLFGYLFLPLMLGALYFLMIAPQRRKQKQHDKMLAALQSGDDILTNGGIFGTITNVKDDRFVVRVADNIKIEVAKGFVNSTVRKASTEDKK